MAGEQSIRVVNAGRRLADVLALPPIELETLLRDLAAAVELAGPAGGPANLRAFLLFARLARRARERATTAPLPAAADIIRVRQLLYNPGVQPYGTNATTSPKAPRTAAADPADLVRPPAATELWLPSVPKYLKGAALAAWATAAAADDRLALEGLVVVPAALGAGREAALEWAAPLAPALLRAGAWSATLPLRAGALLGSYRRRARPGAQPIVALRAADRAALEACVRLLRQALAPQGRPLPAPVQAHAKMTAGRGAPLFVPRSSSPEDAGERRLSEALLALERVLASGAGVLLLQGVFERAAGEDAAAPPPPPAPAEAPPREPAFSAAALELAAAADAVVGVRRPATPGALGSDLDLCARIQELAGSLQPLAAALAAGAAASSSAAGGFLQELAWKRERRRAAGRAAQRTQTRVVKAKQYLIIAEEKLGRDRFRRVVEEMQRDPLRYDFDSSAAVLDAVAQTAGRRKGEVALVEAEYANRARGWELQAANRCDHLAAVRRLRAAPTLRARRAALDALGQYGAPGPGSGAGRPGPGAAARKPAKSEAGFLLCKSCGFELVCPHALELVRLELRMAPYDEVRRALAPYASPARRLASGGTSYAVYCRVCSEELYLEGAAAGDVEQPGRFGNFENDLKRLLWVEAMRVVDPRRAADVLVRFSQPVNPERFAAEASEVCHPLVAAATGGSGRRAAFRGQGRAAAGGRGAAGGRDAAAATAASPVEELIAVIYLYAYFFALALDLPPATGGLAHAVRVSVVLPAGAPRRGGRPLPDAVASALLTHLVRSKSLLIARLEHITHEQIGNQFRDAYQKIQDAHGRVLFVAQDSARVFATNVIELDPYFAALRTAQYVAGGAPIAPLVRPADAERLFLRVMGRSLADCLEWKPDKRYEAFIRTALSPRGGVLYPPGVPTEWVYAVPELQLYRDSWGVRNRAGQKYWERLGAVRGGGAAGPTLGALLGGRERRPAKPATKRQKTRGVATKSAAAAGAAKGAAGAAKGAADANYADGLHLLLSYTAVRDSDTWDEFQSALALARAREADRERRRRLACLPNFDNFPQGGATQPPPLAFPPAAVTRLYDEEGRPHKWKVFLWAGTKGVLALEPGERAPPGYAFSDWKCATCGVTYRETARLDARKVEARLEAQTRMAEFFVYFESRCPEGGLHRFAAEKGGVSACEKCGIQSDTLVGQISGKATPAALPYYDKYAAVFVRLRREEAAAAAATPQAAAAAADAPPTADELARLQARDYKPVLQLVELVNEALGRTRGAGGGRVTAAEVDAMGGGESRTLEDVRLGKNLPDPPAGIDDPRLWACDNNVRTLYARYARWARGEAEAGRDAPAAAGLGLAEYVRLWRAGREAARGSEPDEQKKWAEALLRHAIEGFCRGALAIAAGSPERRQFAGAAAAELLRRESMFTVPGEFSWSVFGDAEDSRGTREVDISRSASDAYGADPAQYDASGAATESRADKDREDYDGYDVSKRTLDDNLDLS